MVMVKVAGHAAIALASMFSSAFTYAFTIPPTTSVVTQKIRTKSALSALPPEILDGFVTNTLHSASVLLGDDAPSAAVEAARQKFWFYFFAGSGAGGIGISQLPAIFRDADEARSVAGTGSTLGGEPLNAGPLLRLYYDNDISKKDVEAAIETAPTSEFISSRRQSQNYMASKGYIERSDFTREMEEKGCNPLASYALFDAISSGKGGVVSPVVYDDKLAAYRGGGVPGAFVGDLNGFLAVKFGAFLGLIFCLIVDFGFIAKAGIEGFLS